MYLFSCFLHALLGKNALIEIQVVQIKESDKVLKKKKKIPMPERERHEQDTKTYARCLPRGNRRI